jgi:hypothetical protein
MAVLAVLALVSALIAFSPRPSTATLVVSSGQVTVMTASHPEQTVTAGQAVNVRSGDNLAVKSGSQAQLRLYDGSSVDLSENTLIEVQELATSDAQFRVRLKMLTGRTVSRVLRLLGAGDAFEISTPSSTVSVRGTIFVVQVLNATTTYVGCDKGMVWVASGSHLVEVPAGQELTITSNQMPMIQPKPTQEPATAESRGQNTSPSEVPVVSTPLPAASNPTQPPAVGAGATPAAAMPAAATPAPASTEALNPSGGQSTPVAPAVPSGPSGPQGTPNKPSQVPGHPPSVVPGNGDPPSGGGVPPGKGGEPPGQTKDKGNNGKGKGKSK